MRLCFHADQLEVSPDGKWLNVQPLAGPLYRVESLDGPSVTAAGLSRSVELWYGTNALGGTAMDSMGNVYLEGPHWCQQKLSQQVCPDATYSTPGQKGFPTPA